jgi:quinolinate synthase
MDMPQLINAVTPLAEARTALAESYDLRFTKAVDKATAGIKARLENQVPAVEWPLLAPLIFQINRLKQQRDAVILAHNFQVPPIFYGVADVTGDSLGLARAATRTDRAVIVQCGIRFMAETSKLLNPEATVLIPDSRADCSLAASITAADIAALRAHYPGLPVVTHLNTTAEVKAAADICCTSANAVAIVDSLPGDGVIIVPDQFLARNIARHTAKKLVTWAGACEVHESFTPQDIADLRDAYPGAAIIAHPECPPDVAAAADFTGATAGLIDWVRTQRPARVVLVTECSMADNIAAETEGTEFVRGCNICPHMKRITLENILWSLHTLSEEITIAPDLAASAAKATRRMLEVDGQR